MITRRLRSHRPILQQGHINHFAQLTVPSAAALLGQDMTTLRVELPGQPALWGIIERMMEFGLRLIDLRVLTVPHVASWDGSAGRITCEIAGPRLSNIEPVRQD
jgi:hypothetical protein